MQQTAIAPLLLLLAALAPARAPALASGALGSALDRVVDVELFSGEIHKGVKLLRVRESRKTGEIRSLRLEFEEGKKKTINIASIRSVRMEDRVLFEADAPPKRMTRAERRAAANARDARQQAEQQLKWLALARARGVQPWPEVGESDHQRAIQKSKATGLRARQLFPDLRLHETEQFLFYSNIPPGQATPLVSRLDAMHKWMMETYNLPPEHRVWLGKAPVYAFKEEKEFIAFEQSFFESRPQSGTYGLCHQNSAGEVVIACFQGQDQNNFAQMLVHETSHGFIHRYKTVQSLPSWVNEGMADYIGAVMVPDSTAVSIKEARALAELKQRPVIRADFFGKGKIEFKEYGIASSINRFMLETDPKGYVAFIEYLKIGMKWDEALRLAFHSEPSELISAYGRSIRIPELRVE